MLVAVSAARPTAAKAIAGQLADSGLQLVDGSNGLVVVGVRSPFVVSREADVISARPSGHTYPEVRVEASSLVASVGPLSQLPLYCATTEDAVVLSSSLDVLRRLVDPQLEMRRVVAMASGLPDPWPGDTVFAGIRRLTAGTTLTVRDGVPSVAVTLPECGARFDAADPDALAHQLRSAITTTIEDRARVARHVGVLVGGGLDSSGLLAFALECLDRKQVTAIAEVWRSPGEDLPYLEALETFLGVRAHRRRARDAAPWLLRSLCADAQPQLWPGASHDMMLWCAARELGTDLCLGGYGGDIVLGGRPSFAPVVRRHPLRAVRGAMQLRVPWAMSPYARIRSWVVRPALAPFVPRRLHTRLVVRRLTEPWMRKPFIEHVSAALEASREVAPRNPNEWLASFANDRVLAELNMSWGAMAIETKTVPYDVFRDLRVVMAMARADPLSRMDGDYHRGLFRRALRGRVPELVRLRNDKATMEPGIAESIVAAGAIDEIAKLGSLERLADLGLVEPSRFRPIFEPWLSSLTLGERSHPHPADEWWRTIWQLISVERFLRAVVGAA